MYVCMYVCMLDLYYYFKIIDSSSAIRLSALGFILIVPDLFPPIISMGAIPASALLTLSPTILAPPLTENCIRLTASGIVIPSLSTT